MDATVMMLLEDYEELRDKLRELKEVVGGSMFDFEKSYEEGKFSICLSSDGKITLDKFKESHPEYEFEHVIMTAYNVAKLKEPVEGGDA
jgi:hypothetical protein